MHRYTEPRKWYPNRIDALRLYLEDFFYGPAGEPEERFVPVVSNIAYTLQYLQFLDKLIRDLDLTGVLITQIIKSFVINGCAIVEAVFFKIVSRNGSQRKRPTFDAMCKTIQRHNLIDADNDFYTALLHLRRLRNRVHIFDRDGRADTDYLKIEYADFNLMKNVLEHILFNRIFPRDATRLDFAFLEQRASG